MGQPSFSGGGSSQLDDDPPARGQDGQGTKTRPPRRSLEAEEDGWSNRSGLIEVKD
jgi:hypothetical protein